MKKLLFLYLFLIISYNAFSQNNDLSAFMIETNAGYAIGVDLDSAMEINVRLICPLQRFGVIVEGGILLTPEKYSGHIFIAPMMFIINNEKWKVPLAVGFDLFHGETLYYGIGGSVSLHYRITKNIYAGVNLGLTYAFNNRYDELTGYTTKREIADDGTGHLIYVNRVVPVFESMDHFGSYIYIKPSLSIGFQL